MSSEDSSTDTDRDRDSDHQADADLVTELEVLREENRRLRTSYVRAQQSTYRRTALGFVTLGILALVGGVFFPELRTILFAFGGIGVFAAVLTYLITPERFVSGAVGGAVYRQLATSLEALSGELGLSTDRVYIHREGNGVRLFVPQRAGGDVPTDDALESVFVVPETNGSRGVSIHPTGDGLFREFKQAQQGAMPDDVADQVASLREAVVEQFELADGLDVDLERSDGRLSVRVQNPTHGAPHSFDHPVVSFIACGLARGLDTPVRVESITGSDDSGELVTLRWTVDGTEGEASHGNTEPDDREADSEEPYNRA